MKKARNRFIKNLRYLWLIGVIALGLITIVGSGGGGEGDDGAPTNNIPVANAGADQTVNIGDNVQLDGSGSSDADGDSLTYSWSITSAPEGSTAALSDAAIVNPTFTPDVAGEYTIQLVVNDGEEDSAPDDVSVACSALGDQYEPNDSFLQATAINVGTTYNATIHAFSNVDYFKVPLNAWTVYTFTLTVPSAVNYDLAIYNSNQEQVASSLEGGNESLNYTCGVSGDYFIKVYSSSGYSDSDSYTIRVAQTGTLGTEGKIYVAHTGNTVSANSISVIDGTTDIIIATIPGDGSPSGVGVNSNTDKVYVTNYEGTVSVINGLTNNIITSIAVGNGPWGVGVNTGTNRIYVANNGDDTVTVIDGSTNSVIDTITVGAGPGPRNSGVGVNENTNKIYVANNNDQTVSVIDGSTNSVITTVTIPAGGLPGWPLPFGAGVNVNTNRIYVVDFRATGVVSVIDGSTDSVIATLEGFSSAHGIAVDTTANRIYIANLGNNAISVIDGSTNMVTDTVIVGECAPFEAGPIDLRVYTETDKIYIASSCGDTVEVISRSNYDVIATISLPTGGSPQGLGILP